MSASDDLVTTLREEHARLRDELQKSVVYQRMVAIEGLIGLYVTSWQTAAQAAAEARALPPVPKAPRSGTIAAAVVKIAEDYLRTKGSRAQTPEIAAQVQKEGVLVNAANVIAAVSSYLSTAKTFDNVRGEGYGLIEWLQPPREDVVAAEEKRSVDCNRVNGEIRATEPI